VLGVEDDSVSDPVPLALLLPLLVSVEPLELELPEAAGVSLLDELEDDGVLDVLAGELESLPLPALESLPLPALAPLVLGLAALGSVLLSVFAPSSFRHCAFSAPLIESQRAEPPAPYVLAGPLLVPCPVVWAAHSPDSPSKADATAAVNRFLVMGVGS